MENENVSKNFIEQMIDKDIEEGHCKVVHTRFPPEPNGYLHIGHAKSILLNYGLAQKYGGKFNLRFDDTNPTKEKTEFVEAITEDIKWLGADWEDRLFFASDYFDQMYECAVELIKKGKAYVSDLSAEQIREYRGTLTEPGKEDPYSGRSVEENLKLFEEMREGKYADGEKVLRARIDMSSSNINMRDPVIYRVAHMTHHRTGDKWCIYPMYDFAHPLEDAIEGITHSICTLEFEDHRPLYEWVINEVGAQIIPDSEGLLVKRAGRLVSPLLLETDVYPGYPTDLQSPMLTALCCAEGNCMVSERVFNGRFGVHEQLNRMGAAIVAGQTSAEVTGGRKLHGERVFAKELRGGAALVLAGLCAEHKTVVENCHFIRRGYEDIVRDFRELGADIGTETEI